MSHKLLDVSHHNGIPNYDKARDMGVEGIIAKASQGNYFTDSTFDQHYAEARKRQWFFGAYHYMDFTISGEEQFEYFRKAIGPRLINLAAGDFEDNYDKSPATCTSIGVRFMTKVAENYPMPTVYTRASWWNSHMLTSMKGWKNYNLWVAQYETPKPSQVLPWDKDGWTLWQYEIAPGRQYGVDPAVNSSVDVNVWNPGLVFPYPQYTPPPSVPPIVNVPIVTGEIIINGYKYQLVRIE